MLAGCFARFGGRPDVQGLVDEFRTLSDPIDPAYARAWQESTLARPVSEAFLDMIVEETVKPPARSRPRRPRRRAPGPAPPSCRAAA